MSDKFGRHKSTRWVKAVPTYDNDWGDEYDYDYGSDIDKEEEIEEQPPAHTVKSANDQDSATSMSFDDSREIEVANDRNLSPSFGVQKTTSNDQISHHSGLVDEAKEENHQLKPQPASNLVLSIDKMRPRSVYYDSSDEDEEVEEPQHEQKQEIAPVPEKKLLTIEPPVETPKDAYVPPTPVFNNHPSNPETPQSDLSYQSDADSIQREPAALNVGPIVYLPESPVARYSSEVEPVRGFPDNETIHEVIPEKTATKESPVAPAPLVLSIDNQKFDDDSDEDDWGYNSQHSSNDEAEAHHEDDLEDEMRGLKLNKSRDVPSITQDKKPIKTDALDSLINDLGKVSVENDSDSFNSHSEHDNKATDSFLPRMDSIHNISLPDFENNSFGTYSDKNETFNDYNPSNVDSILDQHTTDDIDDENAQPPTPVAPLSHSEARKGHESFVQDLSGHRPSIRKPPPSKAQEKSIEPNSRLDLVSVDYSNIADAVSGYINDDQSSIQNSLKFKNKNNSSNDHLELRPVTSSGSLSTGKLSVATSNHTSQRGDDENSIRSVKDNEKEPPVPEKNNEDLSRRMSTMTTNTTNTFNLGGWKPNTGNFRDQFINDNDNESQFSFNPSIDSGYSKFTNVRDASGISFVETSSNASSLSVPETIDIALPRIPEDHGEESEGDLTDDQTGTDDDKHKDLGSLPTNVTADTVLKDHDYPKPLFNEERMTPHNSLDHVPQSDLSTEEQKEKRSSLVSDSTVNSDKDVGTDKRLISSATDATDATEMSKKSYIQQPRPKYNWKQIMNTSQPVDRIRLLKEALEMETVYDTGLLNWLHETLKLSENTSSMHVGKIASQAYQNAAHQDIRRHGSIRSKVNIVKDKVETSGLTASSFGKRFLSRGRKLMKSGSD